MHTTVSRPRCLEACTAVPSPNSHLVRVGARARVGVGVGVRVGVGVGVRASVRASVRVRVKS